MTIEIKHRWTNRVIYSSDKAKTIREALLEAVAARADLRSADLRSAYLSGADLSGADLSGADLSGAYLRSADLSGADLSGADLRSADLSGADLSGADLRSADLRSAYLSGADLSGADLSGADLRSAYLSGADLSGAKGVVRQLVQPLMMLLEQEGPIRAYKLTNEDAQGYQYPTLTYEVGKEYSVDNADTDPNEDCGAGIHVATLDWVIREWRTGYRIFVLEFNKEDIACIPMTGGGKFRLHRCKVVAEKTLEEVGIAQMQREAEEARKEIEERKQKEAAAKLQTQGEANDK